MLLDSLGLQPGLCRLSAVLECLIDRLMRLWAAIVLVRALSAHIVGLTRPVSTLGLGFH